MCNWCFSPMQSSCCCSLWDELYSFNSIYRYNWKVKVVRSSSLCEWRWTPNSPFMHSGMHTWATWDAQGYCVVEGKDNTSELVSNSWELVETQSQKKFGRFPSGIKSLARESTPEKVNVPKNIFWRVGVGSNGAGIKAPPQKVGYSQDKWGLMFKSFHSCL